MNKRKGERRRDARRHSSSLALLSGPERRSVAALISSDSDNYKSVGKLVHKSENTVRLHVSSAMGKLGVSTKFQLAMMIIDPDKSQRKEAAHKLVA